MAHARSEAGVANCCFRLLVSRSGRTLNSRETESMTTSCPCCLISAALKNYEVHSSLATYQVLKSSLKSFTEMSVKLIEEQVVLCLDHQGPASFKYWKDHELVEALELVKNGDRYEFIY